MTTDEELIEQFKLALGAFGHYLTLSIQSVQIIGYDPISDSMRSLSFRFTAPKAMAHGSLGFVVAMGEQIIEVGTVKAKTRTTKPRARKARKRRSKGSR